MQIPSVPDAASTAWDRDARLRALTDAATRFRNGIEACDRAWLPGAMEEFPLGSCGVTAVLLGTYLEQAGFGAFDYVLGHHGERTHAWIAQKGTIVDITADQFPDMPERIIVSAQSAWHAGLPSASDGIADYRQYDGHAEEELEATYLMILERIVDTPARRGEDESL
jgi:hypothetical protein